MKRLWVAALAVGVSTLAFGACGDDDDDTCTSSSGEESTATANPAKPAGLDPTFGQNGILSSPLSTSEHDRFMSVAIGNDGSVYAAGFVNQGGDQAMALTK